MRIIVCPLHDVEALARVRRPSHILSLISPSADPTGFECLAPHHLELRFNDITEPRDGLIAPTADHIRAILDFARDSAGKGPLLIHCWAGVSRSTAAAFIVACDRYKSSTSELATRLRTAAPYCTPNKRMIAIADDVLGAQGEIIRPIAAIGRGHDTTWGSAFELSD